MKLAPVILKRWKFGKFNIVQDISQEDISQEIEWSGFSSGDLKMINIYRYDYGFNFHKFNPPPQKK